MAQHRSSVGVISSARAGWLHGRAAGEPLARLSVLGPFELHRTPGHPGAPSSVSGDFGQQLRRKTRALLAYLAAAHKPVRREALASLFFSDTDDPLGALRWHLSAIRRRIGPVLAADRDRVQLDHTACWVDASAFERALDDGPARSIEQVMAALELYRGDYLADMSLPDAPEFDMWVLGQRAYYRQRYEQAAAGLVEQQIQRQRYAHALPWAQRLVQSDALAEPANLQLIRLYALNGQREAALAHYERYRRLLEAELRAAPGPEVVALHAEIASERATAAPEPIRPASEPDSRRRHTLLSPTTPFLGREAELAQLRAMLADSSYRLVTLAGSGGIGKTRLALQLAIDLLQQDDHFMDGVHLAALAAIPSGALLVPAIADAVGLSFSGTDDPKRQLLAFLQSKMLLLVLDNFEHLLDAAGLLAEILGAAPGVTILTTSRARLNLYEEWCFELHGLPLPDSSIPGSAETNSAAQLFVERARRLRRDFRLETERPEVVRICQLLDGIPLAIELAAGCVRTYTCREIADEIQRGLDFLITDLRNIPERHRSMRAVFEHSWRLMAEAERTAFARLSVFRGGFDHRAAEQVAGVTRAALSALIDASMVHGEPDGRYQLHELLRQFGAEKLTADVANDIRQRHSRFYATYMQQRESHKLTAQEPAALQEIGVELENVRAGWQWAAAHLLEAQQTMPSAEFISAYAPMLCYFFDRKSRSHEGCQLFRQVAARFEAVNTPQHGVGEPNREIGRAFMWVRLGEAILRLRLGEFGEAERLLDPGQTRSYQQYDPRLAAEALAILGIACMRMGKYDQAQLYLQESLGLYTAIDDSIGRTVALDGLGLLAFDQHQFSEAQTYWQACLAIFRATGYQWGIAKALSGLASNMGRHGIYEQAKQLIEEALPIAESVGGEQLVAVLLGNLGSASRHLSDHDNSVRYYQRSLEISRRIGDKRWTAATLNGLGITLVEMGRFAAAKAYVLEALELSKTTGNVPDVLDSLNVLGQTLAADTAAEAVALLSLVVNHPITRQLARDRSQQALDRLRESVSPAAWDAAFAHGKEQAHGDLMQFIATQLPS